MAFPGLDGGPIKKVTIVDAGGNPISPAIVSKTQTLAGVGAATVTPIFGLTGSVEVLRMWGVVTTDIGPNHTAAFYRLNDQTSQPAITLATGIVLSALKAGTVIAKKGLAAAALTLMSNAAGIVSEPTTLETMVFSPYVIVKKTAATTNIEYVYSTTDNPTTGVIQHFIEYRPLSSDGALAAL